MSAKATSKPSKTDWQQLKNMKDEDIDYSDIPPLTSAFFERARVYRPFAKTSITLELDTDLLEWFRGEGEDWEERMQAALRIYAEAHRTVRQPAAPTR
jgi:uncharacterized protein (DUF4415 family)